MRHLLVIAAVVCALIAEGWAQNRGSARYVPPEDFEGDVTRAPRHFPTRGSAVRRQRPTKAPEPSAAVEEKSENYQPVETPSRTTGRRIPQRGSSQQVAPPPLPPLPVEEPAPLYPATVEEHPQAPPAAPEGRPQGTRRRRPKKRRRPQAAVPKVAEESEKQLPPALEEEKRLISELLNDDKKRNEEFQSNPQFRHAPPNYDPEPTFNPEKTAWDDHSSSGAQVNAAGPQYYRPQPATNRLPVGDAEPVGNSRGYLESSDTDSPAPYVPNRPQSSVSNEASYVPVLSPVRGPSQGASRLPPNEYPAIINKDSSVQEHPTHTDSSHRGHGDRSPIADPEDIIRNTDDKPVHNIIPQPDEPVIPVRGHSGVRLPQEEQPLLSEYVPPAFDSKDIIAPNSKATEEVEGSPNTSNRLPNPSEIHYDSVYPEYSERPTRGSQRVAGRRQEQEEPIARNPLPSYTTPSRQTGTKPQEYDNDAEIDRRQPSQYRPPIQRGSSRYNPEDSEGSTRPRAEEYTPSTSSPRTRGSTRYQATADDYVPERTRGSTRSRSEPAADLPARTRSPSASQSTRTRGSPRNVPDTNENAAPRASSRRQPANVEPPQRSVISGGYVPVDEVNKNEPRSQSPPSRTQSQPRTESDPEVFPPLINTLRSRPQYEVRHAEPSHTYEESASQSTRTRGSPRNVPDTNENAAPRASSRRQPANVEPPQRSVISGGYVPVDEVNKNEPRSQSPPSRTQSQPRTESDPEVFPPLINTLRSRPQYEVRHAEPSHTYEESVEDPDIYDAEYPVPRQAATRGRVNDRTPIARQPLPPPPPQPEYQAPQNRQQNRQEPQYVQPQNPRSRHQPQYEAPQNPRSDPRQSNNRQNAPSSRSQGRPRQSAGPPAAPSRSSGSNFACPDAFGFYADPVQCDKYYECRNGTAEMHLCSDGLAFNEISSPKFLRCDSLRDVDCKSRPELQEPQPTKNCPRRFGLFSHETDCTKFWNCVDGAATEVQCPPGLTYNDERATCDWADLVESSCKTEDLLGFTCPEPTAHDLQDGVYTRYAHPSNCQLHFTCIKGADGLRRPRMLSCNEGFVFDPATASCARPEEVPGCEDFYGDRRPAPKRKPARQPAAREPEEEIEEEPPTPRPSRRGSNRRVRN